MVRVFNDILHGKIITPLAALTQIWLAKNSQLILAGIVVAAHLLTIDHFVFSIELERNYQLKLKLTEAHAGNINENRLRRNPAWSRNQ